MIRILDYCVGSGLVVKRLRKMGFSAAKCDLFSRFDAVPRERFDLITCFEVMECVPQPSETVTMGSQPKEDEVILFSTLVQPAEFERVGPELVVCRPAQRPCFALLFGGSRASVQGACDEGGAVFRWIAHCVSPRTQLCRAIESAWMRNWFKAALVMLPF